MFIKKYSIKFTKKIIIVISWTFLEIIELFFWILEHLSFPEHFPNHEQFLNSRNISQFAPFLNTRMFLCDKFRINFKKEKVKTENKSRCFPPPHKGRPTREAGVRARCSLARYAPNRRSSVMSPPVTDVGLNSTFSSSLIGHTWAC